MYQFVRRHRSLPQVDVGPAEPPSLVRRAARPVGPVEADRPDAAPAVETPATTRIQPGGSAAAGSGLRIGRAADPAEADADRFAAGLNSDLQISSMAVLRRSPAASTTGSMESDPLGGTMVDAATTSKIRSASGGSRLPTDVQAAAEARSGRDLSAVRIHAGAASARISRSLQATAFTSGSNIFLGADAARPGTSAGNTLLGHELGHVVQQGAPTVRRLLGMGGSKKNSGAARAGAAPASAPAKSDAKAAADQQMMLRRRIGSFELTMTKLRKHKGARTQAEYSVAYSLNAAAEKELLGLGGGVKNPQNNDDRKRLQRLVDESQLIYDEFRVAKTKQRAGEIYHAAGQQGARGGTGLQHLADGAAAFDDQGTQSTDANPLTGESSADIAKRLDVAGRALGLTKAEVAAIATFTDFDYRYINPATANDMGWMKAAVRGVDDEATFASMRGEGTLHAGMAMEGLNKLPIWKGTTYRGEKLKPDEVAQYFDLRSNGKIAIKQRSFARKAISSTSKNQKKANDFFTVGQPVPEGGRFVVWENLITNGRDIEELSVNKREEEVATLPGAEFQIISARLDGMTIRAKVKQIR